jgi:sec-independent protein translocase protein TatA
MGFPGGPELIIILVVLLFLFGAKKLPELARSMGQASKEFKSGLKDGAREDAQEKSIEGPCPFCGVHVPGESKFCPGCGRSATDIVAERARTTKST